MSTLVLCVICWISTVYVTTVSAECSDSDWSRLRECATRFQNSKIAQDLSTIQGSIGGNMTGGDMMEVMTKSLDMLCESNSPYVEVLDCIGKYVGRCMDRLGAAAAALKFIDFSGMGDAIQDLCDNRDVFTDPNNTLCMLEKKSDIEQCFQMKTQSRAGDDAKSRMCGLYEDSALCYELYADCSSNLVAVSQSAMGKMKPVAACRGCTMTGLSAIVLLILSFAAISLRH